MSTYNINFLVSRRATAQGRNMYIFTLSGFPRARLTAGWNLNRTPVTHATFYRWLDLAAIEPHHSDKKIVLCPISIGRTGVLSYCVDAITGPPIHRDSTEFFQPGVYGAFYADGRGYSGVVGSTIPRISFRELDLVVAKEEREFPNSGYAAKNDIPDAIKGAVLNRDGGVCYLTGRSGSSEVVWIFPPLVALHDPTLSGENIYCADNAITICGSLVDTFYENAFAADPENDWRIVAVGSLPAGIPPILTRIIGLKLPRSSRFWQLNLRYTLQVHMDGGEANPDYSHVDPNTWMEELGEEKANLNDPKWQTGIGKEIMEEFLAQQISLAGSYTY
ncbi:hypothetical protein MKEN_00146200 [Mycena kentingensis (nom. inval.)]|nr:hypothetical protein MKEN_00146200 [Mycena kentingensis (nom. inval.)]